MDNRPMHHGMADYESCAIDPNSIRVFGRKLARTERLSGKELRAYQAPVLARLLAHARQTTDFYKDRLEFDSGSQERVESFWPSIPILRRPEAVANREKLKSRGAPPEAGPSIDEQTSGSTGMPFRFARSAVMLLTDGALTERMYRWWRVDGKKSFAKIFWDQTEQPSPRSFTGAGWHSARPNGIIHSLPHTFDIVTLLDWLSGHRPDYFAAYSSILKGLAVAAQERKGELKFDLIFSFGTVVDQDTRDLCRSVFGAEIADTYGAQEVGHIAAQCCDCGEYHISAETCLVEILRDDGSRAAPGEIGRVIVTPLYNYAMPFVRYELGDLAEVGTANPSCGRGLPTLRRILGRDRNLFRFRDGTKVWPSAGRLYEFIALKQFQVVQTDFDHVEIRYVPEPAAPPVDLSVVTQRIRSALRQPVDVTVRAVGAIQRSRNGKHEDFISLVPTG
jgi:phenylacetate-CoA ligase